MVKRSAAPSPLPRLKGRCVNELGGQGDGDQERNTGAMNAAEHEPTDPQHPDADSGLRPVADEQADDLGHGRAQESHAITGRRLRIIITATRDAPK
jgi:hypothetical protein